MSNDRGMYSKIYACFWQDEAVQAMSMPTRYMALYLLTCPHKNLIGYYYLPKAYAREDLCMDPEAFEASLGELIASGFCSYNEKSKTVLIPNYLKYNPMDNEKVVISALKVISEIPKSPLDAEFVKVLETYSRPFYGALLNEVKKRAEIQYAKPSAIPSDIPSTIPYGIPYQKPYAEQYAKPVTVTVAVTESLSPARACEDQAPPSPNQPTGKSSEAISQAVMSLTGTLASPVILEDIRSYQADQGVDEALVLEAISEAKRKGKRTWDYVRGIIRNAIQEGITTGEAFRMRASPAIKHRGRPSRQQTITNGGLNDGNQSAAYSEPGRDWDAEFDAAALARDKASNIAR